MKYQEEYLQFRKNWSRDTFFAEDGSVLPSVIGQRVGVLDNCGSVYYAEVVDALVDDTKALFFRCKYDNLKIRTKVDNKMVEKEQELQDNSVKVDTT